MSKPRRFHGLAPEPLSISLQDKAAAAAGVRRGGQEERMAYGFARDDASVQDGFRRIATEILDKAIRQVEKLEEAPDRPDGDETIHQLRKGCKKLRGLFRLVRPGFRAYAKENAAVRDAAASLSSARDAEVLIVTFDALVEESAPVPAGVATFRKKLEVRRVELARGTDAAAALANFREAMAAIRKRSRRWRLEEDDFDALASGLETSYTRARNAMRAARKDPSAELFHEWRKRAKDHWYHARLLSPIWPDMMDTHVRIAEELGELLGFHHDLCVFQEVLSQPVNGDAEAIAFLAELAQHREAATAAECLALGARLLAERPAALSRRWRAYWKWWRSNEPVHQSMD
jgi:CHAD domain-containing protein